MKRPIITTSVLCSIILSILPGASMAAPGGLDLTFGGTGKIRTTVGGSDDAASAMARQSDGKLVVAGTINDVTASGSAVSRFTLTRYNTNGTLDTTFGEGGKAFVTAVDGGATAVTVLSDGKILAAGYGKFDTSFAFMLAKFNANGTLDSTFSGNGIVLTDFTFKADVAYAMAIQTDGKIVLAGTSGRNTFDASSGLAVARYNPDGSLDTTFSGDGKLEPDILDFRDFSASAVGILNGKIVLAGTGLTTFDYYPVVLSYNSNGTPNTSFDGDGIRELPVTDPSFIRGFANSLTFLAVTEGEDRIVVAGSDNNDLTVWVVDASDGTMDTTFGGDGSVSTTLADTAYAVRIEDIFGTFKIVAAGYAGLDFAVVRFNLNGALDTSFSGDGAAITDISDGFATGQAMVLQPADNKIVVAGSANVAGDSDFAILRYNTNGSLDTTFSGDGVRIDDLGNAVSSVAAAVIQADGKIVAAGNKFIVRFNPNGSFDATFDGDGRAKTNVPNIGAAAIQTDGKIVVAGYVENFFLVGRFNTDGSPDTSFSSDGLASGSVGSSNSIAKGLAIQPDGKIVVAGSTVVGSGAGNIDFAVIRFLPNGTLDTSFDFDGRLTTAIGTDSDRGNAIALQPDGKIVVAGSVAVASYTDFAFVRYNPDGSLDTTFSFDGKLNVSFGVNTASAAQAVAIQSGKIVAAGAVTSNLGVVRLNLADGSPDTTFDSDGQVATSISPGTDAANAVAIESNGKILVAGVSSNGKNNDFAVVRYNADGSLDAGYGAGGVATIDFVGGNDVAYALVLDSAGKAVVAGEASNAFALARLEGGGTPPAVVSAVSRRVHGSAGIFDINLPLTGTPGLECRSGANQVVVTFPGPVSLDGYIVNPGTFAGTHTVSGSTVTLNFNSGGPARAVITLLNVMVGTATGDVAIPMNILLGDANGNGSVTAADIGQTKAFSGQTTSASNFRTDFNFNGGISASDIGLVKSASGTQLP